MLVRSGSGAKLREPRAVRAARDAHVNVILAANRGLGQLEEICREHGLTHSQYVALWVLCLGDDPDAGLPIGSVADGLLTRAADVTRLVDRLEQAGLAERFPHPTDRRGVLVRATRRGRDIFAAATAEVQAFHRTQWSNLDPAELDTLNRLLVKALWGPEAAEMSE